MLTAIGLAVAIAAGVPLPVVALGALAAADPRLALGAVASWAIVVRVRGRTMRDGDDAEARYIAAIAAELRAGASLRVALADAAGRVPELTLERPVRLAVAGVPLDRVAAELSRRLPEHGTSLAVAVRMSGRSGAKAAAVFDALAAQADERRELHRELRSHTAQARLSAAVVGFAPLVFGALVVTVSRDAFADPVALGLVAGGAVLELLGAFVIAVMLRRATA